MNKQMITIMIVVTAAAFLAGRFSAPEKIKIETKTVTIEKTKDEENKSSDAIYTVTEIKKPDGTIIKRVKNENKQDQFKKSESEKQNTISITKEITVRRGVVVSALAGGIVSFPPTLIYGVSVQKEILGPINAGVWGLSSKTFGISLGLEF